MDAKIELAYFPIIGRGEQILILCAEHGIDVKFLNAKPFGDDFDKDTQAPFGTLPWMRDTNNDLIINDSFAIIQYLVNRYDGPARPRSEIELANANNMWAWVQDYYSFVMSPFHDIITEHKEPFWRNLRLTDTLADGGIENGVSKLKTLHEKRINYLEATLKNMNSPDYLSGEGFTYADIFLYTCVRAIQKCKGFQIFRDACGGDPFRNQQNILAICERVEKRPNVKQCVSDKFDNAPI